MKFNQEKHGSTVLILLSLGLFIFLITVIYLKGLLSFNHPLSSTGSIFPYLLIIIFAAGAAAHGARQPKRDPEVLIKSLLIPIWIMIFIATIFFFVRA